MNRLIAAFLFFTGLPSYAAELGVSVRLAEVAGGVSARASSSASWIPVKDGTILSSGGEVKTGAGGSAVLAFSDGNKIRLGSRTTFGIEGASTVKTSLRLFSGRLQAWVKRVNNADFIVRHSAGVAAVRGTIFEMEGTDKGLRIGLFEGGLDIVDSFGRPSSMTPGQNADLSQNTGLQGISALPADTKTPEEPQVETPEPPKTAAEPKAEEKTEDSQENAPETIPPKDTDTTDNNTGVGAGDSKTSNSAVQNQETDTCVSPSSPTCKQE